MNNLKTSVEDETRIIDKIVENYTLNYESINAGEYIIKQLVFSALFEVPVSENYLVASNRLLLQRIIKVAQNIPYFNDLPSRLQKVLLKHNAYMAVILRDTCYNEQNTKYGQITGVLGKEEQECSENMIKMLLKSNVNPNKNNKQNYIATISRYMKRSELERVHLLIKTITPKVRYDPKIIILLSHVVLFCTDFNDECLTSEDRWRIQKIHEELTTILQRYLLATFPQSMATRGFLKVMETLVDIREIATIKMTADGKLGLKLDCDKQKKTP